MRRTSFLNVNDKLSILTNQLIVIKILLRGRGSTRSLPCGGRQVPTIPPSVPILEDFSKGWGLSAKLGKHSAIWGKLGTAPQAYALNPCTKFPPNPTSRKVNT